VAAAVAAAALAALLVGSLAGLVRVPLGPGSAHAAGAACEKAVVQDWSDNGQVDGAYPLSCYREAIDDMPPDMRNYSDAPTEIERALAVASNRTARPKTHARAAAAADTAPPRVPVGLIALGATAVLLGAGAFAARLTRSRRRPAS
jgi:hypothetical protein